MHKPENAPVTCKNCGHHFKGKFCNLCGEKVYAEHDKTIVHFFEEGLHFITHLDGTLLTTIKTIFTKPGKLSLDYCNGIRKRYFKPLTFFLLLIVLYLLFPFLEGLNMRMKYYESQDLYGDFAAAKIEAALQQTGLSREALSEKFHQKGEKVSKFLLIILIPFTALFFYLTAFLKRRYFFDHLIFAAEINAVYLFWGFLIMPLLITLINLLIKLITGSYFPFDDTILGIIIYAGMCIYLFIAARLFYQFKWWQNLLFITCFYIAHTFIVFTLYKFLLFVTVINQIN